MMKRSKIACLLLAILVPAVIAAGLIVSNIYRGEVTQILLPENLVINEVIMPENITIGVPFTMYINVTNPNDFEVRVRLYINFTLVNAGEVTSESMSYLEENNFTYVNTGPWSERVWVEDSTWRFCTPYPYDAYFIVIPPGTHVYYIKFQLNTQCTSLQYAVWFQTE